MTKENRDWSVDRKNNPVILRLDEETVASADTKSEDDSLFTDKELESEVFWAGRNLAARHSARVAA